MPRFTTAIDIDGQRVEINIPRGTKAWRLANSVFCPLGPAPTQAWFVLTKQSVDSLDENSPHTVTWIHLETDDDPDSPTQTTRTLTFPGLYIVKAERLLHGAPADPNALYLVEFADARLLAARKSDSGALRVNLRSYANAADYLPETSGGTWTSLLTSLWNACSVLGAFPGLPGGIPIDGQPENTWMIGLSAYRALNAVLEQLDCAICHNPLTNTYTIVQLGGTQTVDDVTTSLQWNAEPVNPTASRAAANLNIYFAWHRKAYGQERDTELNLNWAYEGDGTAISQATGITGAQGTIPLWDDLPCVFGETNTQINTSAITTRAENRKSRYVTRWSVENKHRIHWGLLTDFIPGGQIRAVLWRNWNDGTIDGVTNPLGGTVTEFICRPELVTAMKESGGDGSGPAWFDGQLAAPEREMYSPPDYNRHTFPNYPRLPNIVQVWDTGSAEGDTIQPNDDGFHSGFVKRWVANTMATLGECWILFVDDYDNVAGQVDAIKGEYYGPARLSGVTTSDGGMRPVYLVRKGGVSVGDDVVFELLAPLALSGQAVARICGLVGGNYVANGAAIVVEDFYENPGEWQGEVGYRGKARRRSDGKYDIIWMERPALLTRARLDEDFVTPSLGVGINPTTASFFQQGEKSPPDPTQVFDPDEMYPRAIATSKLLAVFNSREYRLETMVAQQQCLFATANLNQTLLPENTEGINITEFRNGSFSPFNLRPDPAPTTCRNPFFLQGENGKKVWLAWDEQLGDWIIVQVTNDQSQSEFVTLSADNDEGNLQRGGVNAQLSLFRGRVVVMDNVGEFRDSRECVIQFMDFIRNETFHEVIAEFGRVYGPAKWAGTTDDGGNKPLYRCCIGEQEFHGKCTTNKNKGDVAEFELYDYANPPTGTGITIEATVQYNKYKANKLARIHDVYTRAIANQIEC